MTGNRCGRAEPAAEIETRNGKPTNINKEGSVWQKNR
jgi:hypothetical protein